MPRRVSKRTPHLPPMRTANCDSPSPRRGGEGRGENSLRPDAALNVPAQPQNDPLRLQPRPNQLRDFLQPRQPRRRVNLQHQRRVVTIQHQARPAIALAVDQPITRRALVKQPVAPPHRRVQPRRPPRRVNRLRLARVQHAHANRRIGIKQTDGEKFVLAIINHRQFAGLPFAVLLANAVRKQPRMPAAQRWIPPPP